LSGSPTNQELPQVLDVKVSVRFSGAAILQTIRRPVLQVSGVRKTYGSTVAVDEVSFEVNDGEIFGLIGPNGAGKTTTMECIEGLRTADRGSISVLGLDPFRRVYKLQDRIGVQLQQAQLQKRIKVWEAVNLRASLYQKKLLRLAFLV
jgi:ABC-2 type transport system ATP-binding protein